MATLVKFRYNEREKDLFAAFAEIDQNGNMICYSHIGQHSSCSLEYLYESRPATKKEYSSLKDELESIGYHLKICK